MLENFNNLSFYFMTTAFGTKDNLNFVIIHGMSRIAFCYKDRLSTIFRNKKIFSVAFTLECSGHNLTFIIQLIMSFFCFYQKIIFCHFLNDIGTKHFQWMSS